MCLKIAVVFDGLVKIVKQMRGTRNIFGYRSTIANQLYLLYFIGGKIYFNEKTHPILKYSWFILNLCGVLLSCTTGLACLLYDTRTDIRKLIDIAAIVSISTSTSIIFPCLVYYYRNQIESMISEIDKISEISSKASFQFEKRIKEEKMIPYNFCAIFVLMFIYSFACIFDVMLFYDEQKVRNFKYYPFPLPNIEKNGSSKMFAAHSLLFVFACPLYWFQWISAITMVSIWGAKCHNELMYVRDDFSSAMCRLATDTKNEYQTCRGWNRAFNQTLERNVKMFQTINRAIDHFRELVQVTSSLAIPVNFLSQVVHIYFTISMDMPFSVRLKGITFCSIAIWPMFLLYWVGEILDYGISAVSFSVYCSPWYYSVKVRKNVQIFLSQTQKSKNLSMWKVYPLVLRNYSRLVHAIVSTVNLLRRITL